jgi:hypothetical protein
MNKKQLFAFFRQQDAQVLLQFLDTAYEGMTTDQREAVFGQTIRKTEPLHVDGTSLLTQVRQFQRDSQAGRYYAPFDINSKNFMHVPEETKAWFERLGDLLTDSARLSQQGDHADAVACFQILYDLVEALCRGDEIVFADEYGTWMITVDERKIIAAYLESLAATTTPEAYAAAALPLIRRDSLESFTNNTYTAAVSAADRSQKAHLKAEVKRLQIRTSPRSHK